jgi:hypothetical protein
VIQVIDRIAIEQRAFMESDRAYPFVSNQWFKSSIVLKLSSAINEQSRSSSQPQTRDDRQRSMRATLAVSAKQHDFVESDSTENNDKTLVDVRLASILESCLQEQSPLDNHLFKILLWKNLTPNLDRNDDSFRLPGRVSQVFQISHEGAMTNRDRLSLYPPWIR